MSHPEIFPTISMDTELGKYTNYADIDVDYITKRLRDGGLEDSEIAELAIHFSAKADLNEKNKLTTLGRYNHKKHIIEIARQDAKESFGLEETDMAGSIALSGMVYSDTLDHEIEHVVAKKDSSLQRLEKAYVKRMIGRQLIRSSPVIYMGITSSGFALEYGAHLEGSNLVSIGIALGAVALKKIVFGKKMDEIEFNEYLNRPEEKQARLAGENASPTVVLFVQKHIPIQIREGKPTIDQALLKNESS